MNRKDGSAQAKWTDDEIAMLIDLLVKKFSYSHIASKVGHPRNSVASKVRDLRNGNAKKLKNIKIPEERHKPRKPALNAVDRFGAVPVGDGFRL